MIWPHLLTVYPSEMVTDADGNTVRRPTTAGTPALGFLQPVEASETTTDGQASDARYVVFLDPTAPSLDAFSRLEWAGRTFETIGAALWFADLDGCVSYWRATLRTVGV